MFLAPFIPIANATSDRDPSRTITIRNRAVADVNRRCKELKKAIHNYIVTENRLQPITTNEFTYRFAEEKHRQFMEWLSRQEEAGLLEMIHLPTPYSNVKLQQPWMNYYVWSAYQKGLATGRREIKQSGVELPPYMQTSQFPFDYSFFGPMHSQSVALIFTRVFTDLKGVTQAMETAISRTLSQGMIDGLGAEQIARNIASKVDSIGMVRARLIVRTEMIHAFNSAKLNDHVGMEDIIGEEILVKWRTAGDERVRHPRHTARHGKIYKRSDARRLLGEPNCRCVVSPYMVSVHGKVNKKQWGPINPLSGR